MLVVTERSVDDPLARALLHEYFEFRAATFPAGPMGYHRPDPNVAEFVAPLGQFLVAMEDAVPLGCGGIRRLGPGPGARPRFELKHLYVTAAARGRGLGRRLVARLVERAREWGGDQLVLDTHSSLIPARRLYEELGFVAIPAYNDNPNATEWYGLSLVG